jgi:hypothetical protein
VPKSLKADGPKDPTLVTWNDLPRWVQIQRNWHKRHKSELGAPDPEPVWGDDELSQSLKRLYELAEAQAAERDPEPPAWYEFDGDRAAEEILTAWIEHLRCPECDLPGPADFGLEWGSVECGNLECGQIWIPEWVTPWAPPTPKAQNPKKYTVDECPMCGKMNRRMDPQSPYDFVCNPPKNRNFAILTDVATFLLGPEAVEKDLEELQIAQAQSEALYKETCHYRYWTGFQEGWYRFLPAWYPYCKGCGAMFTARLQDQEYCSRECGPMPPNFSKRLRHMAASVSPVLRRKEVFERDGWVCHICGEPVSRDPLSRLDGASIDHVVPIAAGGTHTMENVRTAHLRCNIKKSDAVLSEDELGYLRKILNNG